MSKPMKWITGLVTVLIVSMIGLYLVVRSQSFHNFVLQKVETAAAESSGGRVEISNYAFRLSNLYVDLYDVAIHGTESENSKPLLAVDHLGVGVKILSIWQRKINLNEIVMDRPVIHLTVDRQGHNNIPQPKKKSETQTDIFDLAINNVLLNKGEVYYNDNKSELDAAVRDLVARVGFDKSRTAYDGSLNYRDGIVQMNHYRPLKHDLEAAVSAMRTGVAVKRLQLSTDASRVSFQGNLNDYANPDVRGTFSVAVSTQDLASVMSPESVPAGLINTAGSLRYRSSNNVPLMQALFVDGRLSSPLLVVRSGQARADIRSLQGHYHLEHGDLTVDGASVSLLGGNVTANAVMRRVGSDNPQSTVQAVLHDISLGAASAAAGTNPLQGVPITGRVNGNVQAGWHGSMQGLRVRSDLAVRGSTTNAASAASPVTAVPVNAALHLTYDGDRKAITLADSFLKTPHSSVRLNGTASDRSSLSVQADSEDLHEIDVLALTFRRATPAKPQRGKAKPVSAPQLLGLYGQGSIRGQVSGKMDAPRFAGDVNLTNLQYQTAHARVVHTAVELSPSGVALHNGLIELQSAAPSQVPAAQQGQRHRNNPPARIQFDISAGLRNWNYTESSPINVKVSSNQFPIEDLQRLAGKQYPITGALNVNVSLSGSQLHPSGQGTVQLTRASLWNQPVQSLVVNFRGTGEAIDTNLSIQTPAGNAAGSVGYFPQNQGYQVEFNAPAIRLQQLQNVQARNLPVNGTLTASVRGRGTLQNPQLDLAVQIPQLQVEDKTITGFKTQIAVANQQANIKMSSNMPDGYLEASGDVRLEGDYYTTAKFDTRKLPLGSLLQTYAHISTPIHGETEIHATLSGPLKRTDLLQAHVELPTLSLGYESLELANVAPIRIDYRNGVAVLQPTEFKGTETDLRVQGEVPIQGGGPINASARGNVDLRIIRIFNPETDSSGRINIEINARGGRANPNIQGQIRIVDGRFQIPGSPMGVDKLNGDIALRNNRLELNNVHAQSGGGTIALTGAVAYSPAVHFNLGLQADNVRLRYPRGMRAVFQSQIAMTGGLQSAVLNGQVTVNRVSFTREFDLSEFATQFTGESAPSPVPGFTDRIRLNITIQTAQAVQLESAKLSLQGAANLRVAGTVSQPVILGRTTLNSGEMFFMNNRYQIQNGVIDFANPIRTEPVLNVAVSTTVNQYKLNLSLVGPIERLRTTYSSEPPLPPVDVINLLAFGKTTEQQAAAASTPTTLGAESVLAQGLAGQVSSKVEKLAGISRLSIDPLIGGNQQNPGARLAIQQRVTKNLFFTFATDVTSTQNEIVQIEYEFKRGWSVSLVRDQNGGYAADVRKRKTF